jgi:hypothetical protein
LGLSGDGKVIVLSDSNEEEEVHNEITTEADAAPSSIAGILASTTDTNEAFKGV